MDDNEISVQLYSVRDAIAQDLESALERVAALGLRKVELFGFVDEASRYARALAASGLSAPSAHAPLLQMTELGPVFEAASSCGVSTLIDPFHDPEAWVREEGVGAVADKLNRLASAASSHGLVVGYHNHEFEIQARLGDKTAFERLAELLDPSVVLEVDTYWVQVGGMSAPDLLARLNGRVQFIHVKDGPLTMDDAEQLPAGAGAMDVPALLAAAPQALRVIEFDDYRFDPFDGIAESLRYLRAQ